MSSLLLEVFSGTYSFERRITSPQVSYTGTATFENGPVNKILYREEGKYLLEGIEQICYQKRTFVVDTKGLYIYKDDNSLLNEFRVDNIQVFPIKLNHTHHCKNDRYALTQDIHSFNHFSTAYEVIGPSKDYRIFTEFYKK